MIRGFDREVMLHKGPESRLIYIYLAIYVSVCMYVNIYIKG